MIYEVNDYIICKNGGIWKVLESADGKLSLTEHGRGTKKVFAADSDEIIRKVVSKEEILEIIERIPYIRTIKAPNHKIRREFYNESMAKFDEIEWIKVIKTTYVQGEEDLPMPCGISYSEMAKNFLHSEISVLLEMPMDQVETYIAENIAEDNW